MLELKMMSLVDFFLGMVLFDAWIVFPGVAGPSVILLLVCTSVCVRRLSIGKVRDQFIPRRS